MIDVRNLSYSFDGNLPDAVADVSFTVEKGSVFGLLGPNGAGKSTVVNILVTLLAPGSGTVAIGGYRAPENTNRIRELIGVVFQDPSLDDRLTACENLRYHAELYHVPRSEIARRVEESLERVKLRERRHDTVSRFSAGMKRRLEIARSMMHEPRVLVLDEPTAGLDPQSRRDFWEHVRRLKEDSGLTVMLTTHYTEEAEICDSIAVMNHGRIVALDTPERLKKDRCRDVIVIQARNPESVRRAIETYLRTLIPERPEIVELSGNSIEVRVRDSSAFLPLLIDAVGPGMITGMRIKTATIEDAFIDLTGKDLRDLECGNPERLRNTVRSRRLG